MAANGNDGANGGANQGPQKILVCEDDLTLVKGLEMNLKNEGYEVLTASNGETCMQLALRRSPVLIILDIMLPGKSGLDLCRELRSKAVDCVIIILSVRGQEIDRVLGLEFGADDYMSKPFSLRELLARIRAHLRRSPNHRGDALPRYRFADVELDFEGCRAARKGREITLTSKEFELIHLLISYRGEVLTRDRILEQVWGYEFAPSTRTVDTHIVRLRQKMEPDPSRPRYIVSVYGEGYRFVG